MKLKTPASTNLKNNNTNSSSGKNWLFKKNIKSITILNNQL